MNDLETGALARIADATGVSIAPGPERNELTVDGVSLHIPELKPDAGREDTLLDYNRAFPSKARGDARERILYQAIQEASGGKPAQPDGQFRAELETYIDGVADTARPYVAEAMRDAYWQQRRQSYLIPYHSILPASFVQSKSAPDYYGRFREIRYKGFSGEILPYLCWNGEGVNLEPLEALAELMNGETGFSTIDVLFVKAAKSASSRAGASASAERLAAELREENLKALPTHFSLPTLRLIQQDLITVTALAKQVPRRDVIGMLTLALSMEIALYYYRAAACLSRSLDRATNASWGRAARSRCGCSVNLDRACLTGAIKFRVGIGDRQVSMRDECAVSFREVDAQMLVPLAANIATANVAEALAAGLQGRERRQADPDSLVTDLQGDARFRRQFNAGCSAAAALNAIRWQIAVTVDQAVAYGKLDPGLFALRQSMVEARRSDLKYLGRDVVNQLAKAEVGGFIRTRGSVTFFEVDRELLTLLVRLICRGRQTAFGQFLARLREYGLEPADGEQALLADTLERLGMLTRYSDSGESTYVCDPL